MSVGTSNPYYIGRRDTGGYAINAYRVKWRPVA